jgi:hypothetical protein
MKHRLQMGTKRYSSSPVYAIAFSLLLVCRVGWAQTDAALPTDFQRDDSRLLKRVSVRMPRAYVGEVLERLGELAGVRITARGKDGAADVQVAVMVQDASVADVMEALWSLVSYRGASFAWDRSMSDGRFTYELYRPLAARGLPERLRHHVQEMFETQVATFLKAAQMEPDARAAFLAANSGSSFLDDRRREGLLKSNRLWEGLAVLGEALPPDALRRVLRGEDHDVRIPVATLSERGRGFVHSVWAKARQGKRYPDGSETLTPKPDFISVDTRRFTPHYVAPDLFIYINGSGYNYAGGRPLDDPARKYVTDLWVLSSDSNTDPREDSEVSSDAIPIGRTDVGPVHRQRLSQLAETGKLCIIERILPGESSFPSWDPGPPQGKKIGPYLKEIGETLHLDRKWRRGILLVTASSWFHCDGEDAPWTVVRGLRSAGVSEDGFQSLEGVLAFVRQVDHDQARRIEPEITCVRALSVWYPLLRQIGESRPLLGRLKSGPGVPLMELAGSLRSMRVVPLNGYIAAGIKTVTVEEQEEGGNRLAVFHLRDANRADRFKLKFTFGRKANK